MNALSWEDLRRAERLETREDCSSFLDEIRTNGGEVPAEALFLALGSAKMEEQATAFLLCAARSITPAVSAIESALSQESSILTSAAALCTVACCGDHETFLRHLLLGPDPWTPSKVSVNARHFLTLAVGTFGDAGLAKLLHETLEHPHFFPFHSVARAMELLGERVQVEDLPYYRSIHVVEGLGGVIVSDDERYSGGSNCVHCQFFPCRINHYYKGGIEECKLWNRTDPASLGEIIDQRSWGDHHKVEQPKIRPPEHLLRAARYFLGRGEATAAVPLLCEIIIASEFQSPLQAAVWINLARCFTASGERLLEFIALREGLLLPNLLGLSDVEEREVLDRFANNPETVFGRPFTRDLGVRFGLRGQGYKKAGLPTQALDCYAQGLICQDKDTGGLWFQIGECLEALGELWLAELFFRKAASLMKMDISLREQFLGRANAVSCARGGNDPGLAIERRRVDRAQSDPPDLCIVDPIEDESES